MELEAKFKTGLEHVCPPSSPRIRCARFNIKMRLFYYSTSFHDNFLKLLFYFRTQSLTANFMLRIGTTPTHLMQKFFIKFCRSNQVNKFVIIEAYHFKYLSSDLDFDSDSEEEIPTDYENLFMIENYDDKFGRIRASQALRGFSGKWKIEIRVIFSKQFL